MGSSPKASIDEKAQSFVNEIIKIAPKKVPGEGPLHPLVMSTWDVVIYLAICIPCRHQGQDVLVKILSQLGAVGGIWEGMPGLWLALRTSWNESK